VGGLAVFVVMNFVVLSAANSKVAELKQQLDASVNGAGQLLNEAKALLLTKNYKEAGIKLAALIEKHPISAEAAEGRVLATKLSATQAKEDAAWSTAVVGIRRKWVADEATRLRAQSEKDMVATIEQNWAGAVDGLRASWEK
jgi:hypothetical protein